MGYLIHFALKDSENIQLKRIRIENWLIDIVISNIQLRLGDSSVPGQLFKNVANPVLSIGKGFP